MCTKTLKQKQYLYRNTVPKGYQCLSFYELFTPAPVYLTLELGKKTTDTKSAQKNPLSVSIFLFK